MTHFNLSTSFIPWLLVTLLSLGLFCVVIRAAGIRQAVSWVKESWRKGEELYWNSWMHLDDHTSAVLLLYLYTSSNMHSPSSSSDCSGHTTLDGLWDNTFLWYLRECATLSLHTYLVTNLISGNLSADQSLSGCLFVAFVSFKYFLVDCSCTCFPLPITFFIFN